MIKILTLNKHIKSLSLKKYNHTLPNNNISIEWSKDYKNLNYLFINKGFNNYFSLENIELMYNIKNYLIFSFAKKGSLSADRLYKEKPEYEIILNVIH